VIIFAWLKSAVAAMMQSPYGRFLWTHFSSPAFSATSAVKSATLSPLLTRLRYLNWATSFPFRSQVSLTSSEITIVGSMPLFCLMSRRSLLSVCRRIVASVE